MVRHIKARRVGRLLLAGAGFAGLALVSAGFAGLATTAQAADIGSRELPRPRAPVLVPFFTWNGFYVGINAGYGFGHSKWTNTVTGVSPGNFDMSGALVGGTAGYNLQLGGWLLGIEGDIGWSNIKGSTTTNCIGTCETSSNWLGTARGRFGYAFDRFLPYVTGGAAFGDIKGTSGGSFSKTAVGWTAGGGIEYAFLYNWSAKVEYLYADLGKATCSSACSGGNPIDVTYSAQIVRGGLNYKF
jgi:outer membrane immunogenic protein